MKESTSIYIVSVLIGQSRPGEKRLHSGSVSSELRVEGAVPLGRIVLSYHVFKYSTTCSSKINFKLVLGFNRCIYKKRRNSNNITYCVLASNWVLTRNEDYTSRGFGYSVEVISQAGRHKEYECFQHIAA